MTATCDVLIVGGAAVGSSVAYHLTADPDFEGSVLVVERDPTYAGAATALSAASIRQQFSHPANVRMSRYGLEVIRNFPQLMAVKDEPGPDLGFQPGGYLFLAATEAGAAVLRETHAVQRACGAETMLWSPDEAADAFPHLRTEDLTLASYGGAEEGWFDNMGLLQGFRRKAIAQGAEYLRGEVSAIDRNGPTVILADGTRIAAGTVVNAAGTRGARIARMAGLDIPVEPRKRTLFVFDCERSPEGTARVNGGCLPLMIDSSGVFVRPEGRHFLAGAPPADDPEVDPDDFEPRWQEFEETIWPALAARSPAFEAIREVRRWAGHYDFNTFDQNAILGRDAGLPWFVHASGFSGHGLQQSPAVGRGLAELIVHGGYRTLDLFDLGPERIRAGRPIIEKAVI